MSEQNVEVVRRMYEARDSGDAAGALAQFHPEVVIDATARGDTAIGHGREELAAIIAEWTEAFDEWRNPSKRRDNNAELATTPGPQPGQRHRGSSRSSRA